MTDEEGQLKAALDWLTNNESTDIDRLDEIVAIESVAADPACREEVIAAIDWTRTELERVGFVDAQIHQTSTRPVLTARYNAEVEEAPTVLIYGHVDVQPVEPIADWNSEPFRVTERDGRLWGRGVTDDKGQLLMYTRAIEAMRVAGVPILVNIIMLIDAEEEIGSPSLQSVLDRNSWLGEASVALVSDSPAMGLNLPALGYSLRGLAYIELSVHALTNDLHSGQFGGAVPNAAQSLIEMIASLHDESGRVNIPGFYETVRPLTDEERHRLAELPFNEDEWFGKIGATCGVGEEGFTALERTWARPTLEINGIISGHIGTGPKTIVPAGASAKFSTRMVADQDPHEIIRAITSHLNHIAPQHVGITVESEIASSPVLTPTDTPVVEAALDALGETWNTTAYLIRDGGTIPAVAIMQSTFDLPTLLLGFGCPDENKHAPNEWLPLDHFRKGPEAIIRLLTKLGSAVSQ